MDDKRRGEEEKVSSVQTCRGSVTHAGDSTGPGQVPRVRLSSRRTGSAQETARTTTNF